MRIDRLTLESFGAFTGLSVEFASGLNLFFGENEAGKSTLIGGILLSLLGAPANADRRLRYAPLDRDEYRATIHVTAAGGRALRLERNLAPGGRDRIGLLEGGEWVVARKSDSLLRELGLPSYELGRALMVVSGTEVVLAARDAETVSKAISARATRGEAAVTGQQALKRLHERRILLENKERRAVEEEIAILRRDEIELATAVATEQQLEAEYKQAEEHLSAARDLTARYRPAVEAFDRLVAARRIEEDCAKHHTIAFADLRDIRERMEEIVRAEREMAPLLPWAAGLSALAQTRLHQLAELVRTRREAAAQCEAALTELQNGLALLREQHAMYQRAGFTLERQRELDRIDGAVALAEQNLAAKDAALAKAQPSGRWPAPSLAGLALLALAGVAFGVKGIWLGWFLPALAAGIGAAVLVHRGRAVERRKGLLQERIHAAKEVEFVWAAFVARAGGRDFAAWQLEFGTAQRLAEEIRDKEATLQAKTGLDGAAAAAAEEEFAAVLAAAGCQSPEEFIGRAAVWNEVQRRLGEARSIRDSLLRGQDAAVWEEKEFSLAREEGTARVVLGQAEQAAAGLDPAAVARYREELASLDLPLLERVAAEAKAAHEQHQRSGFKHDPWEVETGLTLAGQALAEKKRRAEAVRLAISLLEQAIAEVQGNLIPCIEARASGLFARLTGGRYDGLSVQPGAEMLSVEPRRTGVPVPGRVLSSGTADQMYLALRLALSEVLQGPEPLPLILDDPFLTFDRQRLGYAMNLLVELGREEQIVLVTKDEVLREMGERAGVRVERLE